MILLFSFIILFTWKLVIAWWRGLCPSYARTISKYLVHVYAAKWQISLWVQFGNEWWRKNVCRWLHWFIWNRRNVYKCKYNCIIPTCSVTWFLNHEIQLFMFKVIFNIYSPKIIRRLYPIQYKLIMRLFTKFTVENSILQKREKITLDQTCKWSSALGNIRPPMCLNHYHLQNDIIYLLMTHTQTLSS